MKVWLPYTEGGSGSDVFTRMLAEGLRKRDIEAIDQPFPHRFQYAPWLLRAVSPPTGTDVTLANTWNGFAFRRPGIRLVTVEHLFVLDPALQPYRSFAQGVFHQTFVRYYEKASMRASDARVAVSQYSADAHHRTMGGSRPLVVLNGIDTEFFTPPSEGKPAAASHPLRLLFVGNFTRRKGFDLLAPIMTALGTGFELEYAVGLRSADTLANLPNTRSLGRLDHKHVREAYRRADLLLSPTRLEGLPLVAMEAMACGTPVIASGSSSLPEVIEDGVTGRLCQQDDALAFANAIRELALRPDALTRMGAAARSVAVSRFSLSRMIDDYINLFKSLVNNA